MVLCTKQAAYKHLSAVILFCTMFQMPVFLDFYPAKTTNEKNETVIERKYTNLAENSTYQVVYKTTLYYIFV